MTDKQVAGVKEMGQSSLILLINPNGEVQNPRKPPQAGDAARVTNQGLFQSLGSGIFR